MARRHFTLEEANALLGRIAPRMERAIQLHLWVRQGAKQLRKAGVRVTPRVLEGTAEPKGGSEEHAPTLDRTRAMYAAMEAELQAIRELGVEVKGVSQGLVDFWSWLDGQREVLLCWKLGEPRIAFYHSPESGFAGRQAVTGHEFTREPDRS